MANKASLLEPLYDQYWLEEVGELHHGSDDWADVMLDFERFCYHHMIINKNGHAVRVVLNEAQKAVANLLLPYVFAKVPEPVDICIVKSRQMGITTLLILFEKYIACRSRNKNVLHIMPIEKLASDLYTEKVEPLFQGSHPSLLPDIQATTTPTPYMKVRKFAGIDMGVNIRYIGGNSKSSSRGSTNQVVIGDEWAFQENPKRLERGVLATRPKTGLSVMVYVSTANGMNHFYDLSKAAKKKNSSIHYLFLPWHMLSEYERKPSNKSKYFNLETWTPDAYDVVLMEEFKKAGYPKETWLNKMAWYEYTMVNEAKGDATYMNSEYPTTDEEPFTATGSPVFPMKVIKYWLEQAPNTKYDLIGLTEVEEKGRYRTKIDVVDYSGIRRYKPPEAGHRYIIGIDTSTNVNGGDASAGVVLDENTMEEACSFVMNIDQDELAEIIVHLARYYNKARIVPERNMGELFINSVVNVMGYANVHIDTTATTNRKVVYGVRMTQQAKREAIRRMKFLMNNNIYKAKDQIFIDQLLHYSYKILPSGDWKAEAIGTDENGNPNRDDAVAARYPLVLAMNFKRWKNYYKK